jgi:GNAT superfamily N-acetyltransferase
MLDVAVARTAAPTVSAVQPGDALRAFDTLTLAFAADPPCRWLFPDVRQYLRYFPIFAKAFGGTAIDRGTALTNHDCSGVALWLAPSAAPDEEALSALIERSVAKQRRADVFALFDEMARLHPRKPHWYLPLIGVEPAQQGRGLGSALLRPVLRECDAADLPAYLEATSVRNLPLYKRHGFEAVGQIKVGGCPPIVPMLRLPAAGRRAKRRVV